MNLEEIIKELRRQQQLLIEAIAALERLLAARGRPRRGRPPKWMKSLDHKPTSDR
jgi:hypothetical protein